MCPEAEGKSVERAREKRDILKVLKNMVAKRVLERDITTRGKRLV
jgi:hypothetical protein